MLMRESKNDRWKEKERAGRDAHEAECPAFNLPGLGQKSHDVTGPAKKQDAKVQRRVDRPAI